MTVHRLPGAKPPASNRTSTASGYRMVNRGNDRGEIYVYGVIGRDWYGDGVTAKQFTDDLKKLGSVKTIDMRINSEGGSVADAEAMYTHLVEHPAHVVSHVDGMAASAASFLMIAGDEIQISDAGYVMIHEARASKYGTAEEFRRLADLIDRTNDKIVGKYAARTGQDEKKIREWMSAETWFVGEEAVKHGFADRVVENLKVAACVSRPDLYRNLPAALRPNRAAALAALGRT